jgi:hypothetical protein
MQELEKLFGIITQLLALVVGWPLWTKIILVVVVVLAGLWLLNMVLGEGGE